MRIYTNLNLSTDGDYTLYCNKGLRRNTFTLLADKGMSTKRVSPKENRDTKKIVEGAEVLFFAGRKKQDIKIVPHRLQKYKDAEVGMFYSDAYATLYLGNIYKEQSLCMGFYTANAIASETLYFCEAGALFELASYKFRGTSQYVLFDKGSFLCVDAEMLHQAKKPFTPTKEEIEEMFPDELIKRGIYPLTEAGRVEALQKINRIAQRKFLVLSDVLELLEIAQEGKISCFAQELLLV
ncbi:MAG: hypothetical protein RML94_00225 [Bacteroidia bacterium]|nr:hypothetical protein [Bacteroidia bacterium]